MRLRPFSAGLSKTSKEPFHVFQVTIRVRFLRFRVSDQHGRCSGTRRGQCTSGNNTALQFDGVNDWVMVQNVGSGVIDGFLDFTFEGWVRTTGTGAQTLFSRGNTTYGFPTSFDQQRAAQLYTLIGAVSFPHRRQRVE